MPDQTNLAGNVHPVSRRTRPQRGQIREKAAQEHPIQRPRLVVGWIRFISTTADSTRVATAVSRIDNLEFLADVIPKTTTYKQFKEKKGKDTTVKGPEMEKGQRTLNGNAASASKVNGEGMELDRSRAEENKPSISAMMNPGPQNSVDERTEAGPSQTHDGDVEMGG